MIINLIRGFCMALADSVPGVSGGTIAFVLGFYDQFIESINTLVYDRDFKNKKPAFIFLIKLGLGWVIGFVSSVFVITALFESHIYEVSSLFIGFILIYLPFLIKEENEVIKGKYINILYSVVCAWFVYRISSMDIMGVIDSNSSEAALYLYLFIGGVIAISAMVLPGISGSTLLLILGLYGPVMFAVESFLRGDFTYFNELLIFGMGILVGGAIATKIISYLLKKYRSQVIYSIVGLMIGSIYSIIVGPTTLSEPLPALSFDTFSVLFFLLGGAVIFGLEKLKQKLETKEA